MQAQLVKRFMHFIGTAYESFMQNIVATKQCKLRSNAEESHITHTIEYKHEQFDYLCTKIIIKLQLKVLFLFSEETTPLIFVKILLFDKGMLPELLPTSIEQVLN